MTGRTLPRLVTVVLALALAVTGAPRAGAATTSFTDVPPGTAFHTEITWLADVGITTGWADGTFRPLDPVNRDAMAAFLYRLAGSPAYTPSGQRFSDVPPTSAFYTEIMWLADRGVSTGWPDGTFRPLEPVNRDAMAAFLYRFRGGPAFSAPAASPFVDIGSCTQFYREMTWLAARGISTGWTETDGRTYRPVLPVQRDAIAAFLYRLDHPTTPIAPPAPTGTPRVLCPVATIPPAPASPDLAAGWNGVRVSLVQQRLGLGSRLETMDATTVAAVRRFQSAQGLPATGVVDRATWARLVPGHSFEIDRYQVQPSLPTSASSDARIEAMVAYALAQAGAPYTWGGAGPKALGFDCSGLVLQALHQAGLAPRPIDVVAHTSPTFTTSQAFYDHPALQHVPVAERRRGDLLFYQTAAGATRHVTIYLGDGRMVEAVGAGVQEVAVYTGYDNGAITLSPTAVRPFA